MTRILFTFLCVIWSSELCRGQEALSVEESTPKPFQVGELFSNGERKKRQVTIDTDQHRKWSEGVYYVFNSTISNTMKDCFRKAAEVWSRDTCIDFKESKIDSTYGYLFVTDDDGYYSHVGRLGDEQPISIGNKCDKEIGRVIHEVGHALGLYHAHSRFDRNKYVTVMPDAMEKLGKEFEIIGKENLTDYGTEYDYGSIMHYPSGYDDNRMLVPADEHYRQTMGSAMLSFTDLWLINTHYGCLGIFNRLSTSPKYN
ncbi:astacin, partial [Ancylostoma caninum]